MVGAMTTKNFTSGGWEFSPCCDEHGRGPVESIELQFAQGRVSGGSEEIRVEGTYSLEEGQLSLRAARDNGSIEYWLGIAGADSIVGTWRDIVPQEGAKDRCQGPFRLWPVSASSSS